MCWGPYVWKSAEGTRPGVRGVDRVDRAGAGLAPPGQITPETEIVRRRDLPDGTAVQTKAGDAVEVFGEDRLRSCGGTQTGQDS